MSTERPGAKLSTRTDDESAEHGLTIIQWHGWYQGRCRCDWDATATSVMSVQLRFGEHLVDVSSAGAGEAKPADANRGPAL